MKNMQATLSKMKEFGVPILNVKWARDTQRVKGKLEVASTQPTARKIHLKQRVWVYQTNENLHNTEDRVCFTKKGNKFKGVLLYVTTYHKVFQYPTEITLSEALNIIETSPNACLYSIISNHPIRLSNKENLTIKTAKEQVMKWFEDQPEGHKQGDLMLDKNQKPQYRRVILDLEGHPDVDLRTSDPEDFTPVFRITEYLKPSTETSLNI